MAQFRKLALVAALALVIGCNQGLRLPGDDTTPTSPFMKPMQGCFNGRLTDPEAYFFWLIGRTKGAPAPDWETVLRATGMPQGPAAGTKSNPSVFYGIAQAISSAGDPRGRLFLPTDTPDANGYYTRPFDILDGTPPNLRWAWKDRGGPAYAPRPCP